VIAYVAAAMGALIAWWGFGIARDGLRQKIIPTIVLGAVATLGGLWVVQHFLFHGHH
jgi:hypothetical protein